MGKELDKDCYSAFVVGEGPEQIVHLLSYSGRHWRVRVDWIMQSLGDKEWAKSKQWTEGDGKTVTPNKIQGLQLKGPSNKRKRRRRRVQNDDKKEDLEEAKEEEVADDVDLQIAKQSIAQ